MRISKLLSATIALGALLSVPAIAYDTTMNMFTGQVTIATGATPTMIVAARPVRLRTTIEQLSSTADIYCAGVLNAPVSTSNGMLVPGTKGSNVVFFGGQEIDCVVSGGSPVTVSYAEEF